MIRVAINGFGRIGRCFLRALVEAGRSDSIKVVAINELADAETICYLTKYDSTHGRFPRPVLLEKDHLVVDGSPIRLLKQAEVANLPWSELGVDLVLECTGSFTDRKTAEDHLRAGAKKVLFSQPADRDMDATVVYGVNEDQLQQDMTVVSAASCTTNAVVPVLDHVHREFGIESGMIRTIHAAMHDQPVIDAYHNTDLRKTRAAFESLIPVDTGLAAGIVRVLPSLDGRIEATAMRVPVSDVSAMDLSLNLVNEVSEQELNSSLAHASQHEYKGVLGFINEPVVSRDFVHDGHSAIIDAGQTRVVANNLAKVLIWFDNEWGYANRMLDVVTEWIKKLEAR